MGGTSTCRPAAERPVETAHIIRGQAAADLRDALAGVTPEIPEKRRQLAHYLWRWALLFILFHELGHLLHGHVDHIYAGDNSASLAEIGMPEEPLLAPSDFWFELRRGQESQADALATVATFLLIHESLASLPSYFAQPTEEWSNRLPYAWAFAVAVPFNVIALAEGTVRYDRRGITHPSPWERLASGATMASGNLVTRGYATGVGVIADMVKAWNELDEVFKLAFGNLFLEFFKGTRMVPLNLDTLEGSFRHENTWKAFDRTRRFTGGRAIQFSLYV